MYETETGEELIAESPQEPYYDSYVQNCAKCNQTTCMARYYHKSSTRGLGNSYCRECDIRYSFTDKTWNCCKLIKIDNTYDVCEKPLIAPYLCSEVHSDKKMEITHKIEHEQKPYKNELSLRIVDDADDADADTDDADDDEYYTN